MAEYEQFSAEHYRDWHTAPAVLYPADTTREPLRGTLERRRFDLVFESDDQTVTIPRTFLTALDPGDHPGELRFTVERLRWKAIVFTPARDLGWIYWAAGR